MSAPTDKPHLRNLKFLPGLGGDLGIKTGLVFRPECVHDPEWLVRSESAEWTGDPVTVDLGLPAGPGEQADPTGEVAALRGQLEIMAEEKLRADDASVSARKELAMTKAELAALKVASDSQAKELRELKAKLSVKAPAPAKAA